MRITILLAEQMPPRRLRPCCAVQPSPLRDDLRRRILRNLATALDSASLRLSKAATGQSIFRDNLDAKSLSPSSTNSPFSSSIAG